MTRKISKNGTGYGFDRVPNLESQDSKSSSLRHEISNQRNPDLHQQTQTSTCMRFGLKSYHTESLRLLIVSLLQGHNVLPPFVSRLPKWWHTVELMMSFKTTVWKQIVWFDVNFKSNFVTQFIGVIITLKFMTWVDSNNFRFECDLRSGLLNIPVRFSAGFGL